MDVVVRPARSEDISQMCGLLADLFALEVDFVPDSSRQVRGLELLLNDRTGCSLMLVAVSGHEVLGMCSVQTRISTAEGGPAGVIEDVVVRKDYRGRGIGSMLLARTAAWCRTKGMNSIHLLADRNNGKALKFYADQDWQQTSLICLIKRI
jgi:GNAT superfamily N-acetyltransferase